jgi:hypothetical protein
LRGTPGIDRTARYVVWEVDIWAMAIAQFKMQWLGRAFSALSTDKKIFGRVGQRTDARKIFVF